MGGHLEAWTEQVNGVDASQIVGGHIEAITVGVYITTAVSGGELYAPPLPPAEVT